MSKMNRRWISASASIAVRMQRVQEIGEVINAICEASENANNVELRKVMKSFKTLSNATDVEVIWLDPKTKKEWVAVMTREELNTWIKSKRRF